MMETKTKDIGLQQCVVFLLISRILAVLHQPLGTVA